MRSSNPALSKLKNVQPSGDPMTVEGAINKSILLFLIILVTAGMTWRSIAGDTMPEWFGIALIGSVVASFVVALIIIFKPTLAPKLAWLYAALEGVLLGSISLMMETAYPGIVIQAVGLTFGAMAVMLFLYKTRIVKVTKGFRLGIIIAIGAVFLTYLLTFILGLVGVNVSMFSDSSNFSIGFSLVVVGIAAFSLMLDFDMMEKGAERRLPKYMEWYTAFGLMITLVWLYLEILKLLGKMRSRN